MALNEVKIRNLKPKDKQYKVADSEGLYLLVKPNGSKLWRLKYRHNGKENVYSIGEYPSISLAEAREERFVIRKQVKSGINPNIKKREDRSVQIAKVENSFSNVALEWHSKNIKKWTPEHAEKLIGWITNDIIPVIGDMDIAEVKSPDILRVIKGIESRGALDVARRVLSICSQIFRYAMPLGKCNYDVTVGIGKTLEVRKRENFKCICVEEFPQLLKDMEKHECKPLTKLALKLVTLTFVRSSELREAKWSEINFDNAEWRIPAERMKMKELHLVPLSKQSIEILRVAQTLSHDSEYIFPNDRNLRKVMSENTLLYALYDMGYHKRMTVHGFRQLASTILNEKGFNLDAIERQLSHAERDNVRRAYNHAQYLPERRKMMQWWADYIDGTAEDSSNIIKAKFN